MAHSVSEKGLCGISKSEMLASPCDPEGRSWGVGDGSECGARRGTGGDSPQDSGEPPGSPTALQKDQGVGGGLRKEGGANGECVPERGWY